MGSNPERRRHTRRENFRGESFDAATVTGRDENCLTTGDLCFEHHLLAGDPSWVSVEISNIQTIIVVQKCSDISNCSHLVVQNFTVEENRTKVMFLTRCMRA